MLGFFTNNVKIKQMDSFFEFNIGKDGKNRSPRLPLHLRNFIIDIDGVLCEDVPNEETERMKIAREIPGAKERINFWYDQGHRITLFTSRTEDLHQITETWLSERGFKYHNLIFNKPRGGNYIYIDDRLLEAKNKIE
jgi:hypothetical protein